MTTRLLIMWLTTTVACGTSDPIDQGEIRGTSHALTGGYAAATIFNHSGLRHSAGGTGIEVDHTRDNKPITTYDASHGVLGDVSINDGPKGGPIKIQTLEEVDIGGKKLFRVWASATSNDGWVESDDVAVKTAHGPVVGSVALKEEPSARAGNGESCEGHGVPLMTDSSAQQVKYIVNPQAVDRPADPDLRWKLDSSTGDWYEFTPGWDKPAAPGSMPDRVFLFWSWIPTDDDGNDPGFAGGGVVRTEMRAGTTFIPCKVEPIRTVLREVDKDSSKPTASAHRMTVFGAYGKYVSGANSFYGWTILASSLNATGDCKMHVSCSGGPTKCPLWTGLPSKCAF